MKRFILIVLLLFSVIAYSIAMAQSSDSKGGSQAIDLYSANPIIATVDGKTIRVEDVSNKAINDLQEQLYNAITVRLSEHVLSLLSKQHKEIKPNLKIQITNEQIEKFYQRNNLKKRGALEELTPQIGQYLRQQIQRIQITRQLTVAREKGWYKNYLEAPPKFIAVATTNTAFIRANPNARVMFLEFSDYQCPFCNRVQPVITNLMKKYKGKVTFAYRHFPLSFHTEADEAANATECAREQGKFEEMHKILYANQRQQYLTDLKSYGRKIGIKNIKQFDQCVENGKYNALVQNDIKEGTELGITGTPGFMIGIYDSKKKQVKGELLSGALPQETFEEILEKFLNKKITKS